MKPEQYDAWYASPRGSWIGRLEYGLLRRLLGPRPDESVLDVGCGTGYFTRCFARDQVGFMREMARVARRGLAVGLLHRHSLLWRREGRGGGQGGYGGAHWHTRREAAEIAAAAGLSAPALRTAITFPSGSFPARAAETVLPVWWPWGGFLLLGAGAQA